MKFKDVEKKFYELHKGFCGDYADDALYVDFMNDFHDKFDVGTIKDDNDLTKKSMLFLIEYLFKDYTKYAKETSEEIAKQDKWDNSAHVTLREITKKMEELKDNIGNLE